MSLINNHLYHAKAEVIINSLSSRLHEKNYDFEFLIMPENSTKASIYNIQGYAKEFNNTYKASYSSGLIYSNNAYDIDKNSLSFCIIRGFGVVYDIYLEYDEDDGCFYGKYNSSSIKYNDYFEKGFIKVNIVDKFDDEFLNNIFISKATNLLNDSDNKLQIDKNILAYFKKSNSPTYKKIKLSHDEYINIKNEFKKKEYIKYQEKIKELKSSINYYKQRFNNYNSYIVEMEKELKELLIKYKKK